MSGFLGINRHWFSEPEGSSNNSNTNQYNPPGFLQKYEPELKQALGAAILTGGAAAALYYGLRKNKNNKKGKKTEESIPIAGAKCNLGSINPVPVATPAAAAKRRRAGRRTKQSVKKQ